MSLNIHRIAFAAAAALTVSAAVFSPPLMSAALAGQRAPVATYHPQQPCRIVGAISHRCWAFHSDSTWPQGLADYHGGNGG
jgi:hypothetical protein